MLRDAVIATSPEVRRTACAPGRAASWQGETVLPASSAGWLSAIDAAWQRGAASAADQQLLVALRRCGEDAAERAPAGGGRTTVRLLCVPLLISLPFDVPGSQIDHALACGARALGPAIATSGVGLRVAGSVDRLLRYDELMEPSLASVHAALQVGTVGRAMVAAVDRLPFHARPYAMHVAPIHLRFVVGLELSREEGVDPPSAGSAVRGIMAAVLAAHLGIEARVEVVPGEGFYPRAHDGLRRYESARIELLLAAERARLDICARVFAEADDLQRRRIRIWLRRRDQVLVACMLPLPCDESERDALRRVSMQLQAACVATEASAGRACETGLSRASIVF